MAEDAPVLVLVTFGGPEEARSFANAAVSRQLAACVNLFPQVESIYLWKGGVERAEEVAGVIKTTRHRLEELEACYRALHSYEVPEFLILPVDGGSPDYLKWLRGSVSGGEG